MHLRLLALGLVFLTPAALAQQANFLPFETEDPDYLGLGRVNAISATGLQAVGRRSDSPASNVVYRWSISGGFQDVFPAAFDGFANDINGDGTAFVGRGATLSFPDMFQGIHSSDGFPVLIGSLVGGGASSLRGVSEDGQFSVGWSATANGFTAIRYEVGDPGMQGELIDIGPNASIAISRAQGCNSDGSVAAGSIAGSSFTDDSIRAARWTAGTGMQVIGPASVSSDARAISADGQTIVGWMNDTNGNQQPALWTQATGLQFLGSLPTGFVSGIATSVSGDGSRVVGNMFGAQGEEMAFLWTSAAGTIERLDVALAAIGLPNLINDPANYRAIDISTDGNVILGSRVGANAIQTEWLALFEEPPSSEVSAMICTAAELNSSGEWGKCSAFGSAFVNHNDVTLLATDLPQDKPGLFLTSFTESFVPLIRGSQGDLCVGGPVGRFFDSISSTGSSGSMTFSADLTALPQPAGPVAAVAGETWFFQAWFRDINPGNTSNLTAAAALRFR